MKRRIKLFLNLKSLVVASILASAVVLLQVESFVFLKCPTCQTTSVSHLKAIKNRYTDQNRKHTSREKRNQLHRVIQSIEHYGKGEGQNIQDKASDELLETLIMLSNAKTQREVSFVGRKLDSLNIMNKESLPIQERVLKATALAGIFSTSLNILHDMLDASYLPSKIAYTAVCSALRKAGRNEQLEELMYDLAEISRKKEEFVDVFAWNIFLASICSSVEHPGDKILTRVWKWMDPFVAKEQFCVKPDLFSYNTLLHAAARVGNQTLVESVWKDMAQQTEFQPDIRAYNSRMMVKSLSERLQILDEIERNPNVSPDKYTIDLVIYALVQEGRLEDVENLLNDFVSSNSAKVIGDAFSAFFITLVQSDNVASARAIFDTYMCEESKYFCVTPNTRHFNILIDGYRRLAEATSTRIKLDGELTNNMQKEPSCDKTVALAEGRKLYRIMRKRGVRQDPYTLSSMMGLCTSTSELINVIKESESEITPAVIRSVITQCGSLGDPSLACRFFDKYARDSKNIRVWNVLLGALSEGAKQDDIVLDLNAAPSLEEEGRNPSMSDIALMIDGHKCSEAAIILLNIMNSVSKKVMAPYPNSQSFCLAASALQYGFTDADVAVDLFRNATYAGIPSDGRFINAVFRCFGDDIDAALTSWKGEIRLSCLEHESRTRRAPVSIHRSRNKNLVAAYNGLLYVCGRALRPDVAVRLAYAMNKEGLEPNNVSLNSYRSGKRVREDRLAKETNEEKKAGRMWSRLIPKPNMVEQYESLLFVECTKYDPRIKRMSKDKKVRIIL